LEALAKRETSTRTRSSQISSYLLVTTGRWVFLFARFVSNWIKRRSNGASALVVASADAAAISKTEREDS